MRIAFHTPLNLFDDGGVSGDRRMARQLVAALRSLGHEVDPVVAPRGYLPSSDAACLAEREERAAQLRGDLLRHWRSGAGPAPDLWFTYHNYYRAPDLLGPALAAACDIPYVTAEASDAPRRAQGEWAPHTERVRRGLAAGDVHFHFTERDRRGLEPWREPGTALLPLPPFIAFATEPPARAAANTPPRLVTIAMMREGTKQNSYLALARILALIQDEDWRLSIIGDGRQRAAIEQAFATLPAGRVTFLGLLDRDGAMQELAAHDIFVWPGIREAYGLVYLEAQAVGLPIIAFDSGGVADTVDAGRTALLVEEGNEAAFAARLSALLADPARRRRLGDAARRFALTERSPQKAAERLAEGLALALENHRAKRKEAER
ncbi:glycosyltransferase family 4 protein [Bosea sp. (in: a-proteobacteria)]|uniref:glycosyltransferase family 4 protein n=1 Tax=Bosea sp. (in: a-proteobacteria) TaxID=1871050 RepID=UPI001205B544|nr:glycosyltransferase family 4 protein [Bosea sp. (in: a-proteobacteria)]TAJ29726.1 MAG: glycosyltransferase [Bosea sp. (in: a-proteobacteria)]